MLRVLGVGAILCLLAGGGAFIAVRAVRASAPPPRPLHSQFHHLVWDDEFNGPPGSRPDPRQWRLVSGPQLAHAELEYYTRRSSNVSLDGSGHLLIVARKQRISAGGVTRGYTSGRLDTRGRYQFRYGRVEARIKVPPGQGLWAAFWGIGADFPRVGWPRAGELDWVEHIGRDPATAYATIHGPAAGFPLGYQHIASIQADRPLSAGFHTYGAEWTPDRIEFTLDGLIYSTRTARGLGAGERWVFNKPFYLILNLAVGGHWPRSPDASTPFPATMLVDWVRVYR